MAGVMLFAMGFFRLGKIIEFIPYTVMTGFTAGIGVTIAAGQVKHLFGLQPATDPGHVIEKVIAYSEAAATARWPDFLIGAAAFALLLGFPRLTRRVPAPLVALAHRRDPRRDPDPLAAGLPHRHDWQLVQLRERRRRAPRNPTVTPAPRLALEPCRGRRQPARHRPGSPARSSPRRLRSRCWVPSNRCYRPRSPTA